MLKIRSTRRKVVNILHWLSRDNDAVLLLQCFIVACGSIVLLSGVLSKSKIMSVLDDYMWLLVGSMFFIVLPIAAMLSAK